MALIWFSPIFGGIFYILFGINRISRAARLLKKTKDPEPRFFDVDTDDEILKFVDDSLQGLVKFGNKVNQNALERGNHVADSFLQYSRVSTNSLLSNNKTVIESIII